MLRFGRYELHAVETGRLRLDGGSMFGVVPRVLWSKCAAPDELNRIELCMRALLAIDRDDGRVILVDSGAGEKWSPEEQQRFALEVADDAVGKCLQRCGLGATDVTDVVVTHLHFDHNGGLSALADEGRETVPCFPHARHWIHAGHLDYAAAPSPKDRGSFLPRDFAVLEQRGMFERVAGEDPVAALPDVEWRVVHGHTPFQLLPRFRDGGRALQYVADLIPTTHHLPLAWVMAFDNQPLVTIREKQQLYRECAEGDIILFFEHDPQIAAARIDVDGRKPTIGEIVQI